MRAMSAFSIRADSSMSAPPVRGRSVMVAWASPESMNRPLRPGHRGTLEALVAEIVDGEIHVRQVHAVLGRGSAIHNRKRAPA